MRFATPALVLCGSQSHFAKSYLRVERPPDPNASGWMIRMRMRIGIPEDRSRMPAWARIARAPARRPTSADRISAESQIDRSNASGVGQRKAPPLPRLAATHPRLRDPQEMRATGASAASRSCTRAGASSLFYQPSVALRSCNSAHEFRADGRA